MKVSIQIPIYNGAVFLEHALQSIYNQSYGDCEVILIDDGSDADISDIRKAYPQVLYCKQEHQGVAAARNRALQLSSGELIAFLDADDVWAADKLEKQVAYLQKHPDCELVFVETQNFTALSPEQMTKRQKELYAVKIEKCLVSSCVRRSVFDKYGNFSEEKAYGEDTELLARWAAAGVNLGHCIPKPLYFRRVHEENMSLLHKNVGKEEYLALLAGAFRKAKR